MVQIEEMEGEKEAWMLVIYRMRSVEFKLSRLTAEEMRGRLQHDAASFKEHRETSALLHTDYNP